MKKLVCMLLALTMLLTCMGTMAMADEEKITLTIAFNDTNARGEDDYRYNWINQTYEAWDKKDQVEIDIQ